MALSKQTLANRRNGRLGGVKTPQGKAVSRLNARTHSILASALTLHDHKRLRLTLAQFFEELQPVGAVETALVEKVALTYLRLQRCAAAEAEYHHACLMPDLRRREDEEAPILRPNALGTYSDFKPQHFEKIVTLVSRYDASLTSQFLKLLHELERRQAMRGDEEVKPPAAANGNGRNSGEGA